MTAAFGPLLTAKPRLGGVFLCAPSMGALLRMQVSPLAGAAVVAGPRVRDGLLVPLAVGVNAVRQDVGIDQGTGGAVAACQARGDHGLQRWGILIAAQEGPDLIGANGPGRLPGATLMCGPMRT